MIENFVQSERKNKIDTLYVREPWWDIISKLRYIISGLEDYNKVQSEEVLKKLLSTKRSIVSKANETWSKMLRFIEENPNFNTQLVSPKNEFNIEGLNVVIIGLNENNKNRFNQIKYDLQYYVERAKKVAPIILKYKLPIEIHMEFDTKDSDAAGLYEYNKIILTAWSSKRENEKQFVKTLAHEMGHHIYKSLSKNSREFWDNAIRGDYGELNVEEVVNMMYEGEKSRDFEKRIKVENPILFLQAEALFYHWSTNRYGIYDVQSLVDAYKEGSLPKTIPVPMTPITGYANKNTEEAFCEALGLFVAYGGRTVHEKIKYLLNTILMPSENYRLGESLDEQLIWESYKSVNHFDWESLNYKHSETLYGDNRLDFFNKHGVVGFIEWDTDDGEVSKIYVGEPYRRKGIATYIWEAATEWAEQNNQPVPEHSSRRSYEGEQFARSIGGYVPRLTDDIDGWSSR
jgi:GNAT superfamily N-acetyltransferase